MAIPLLTFAILHTDEAWEVDLQSLRICNSRSGHAVQLHRFATAGAVMVVGMGALA